MVGTIPIPMALRTFSGNGADENATANMSANKFIIVCLQLITNFVIQLLQ
jgi:hypothetical protein